MAQTLTVQIKLIPTKAQEQILESMSKTYIQTINDLVSEMVATQTSIKKTSKDVLCALPSAIKNQAIKDAKSVYAKARKTQFKVVPRLKKAVCVWNNQNYSFDFRYIYLPLMVEGKAKKTPIRALIVDKDNRNFELLKHKLGTLRITKKGGKWIAQIAVTIPEVHSSGSVANIMGVDLGLKVPAVAITSSGKVRFFGNGRQNKYKKRKFQTTRKKLGKAKKPKAIGLLNNKEQRYMKDQDHKVSKAIVDFACENNVSVIRLENLANIRKTTRTSRKNNHSLHSWSFYRLMSYIEYKAKRAGISVELVNPKNTSKVCPCCHALNKAKDRLYKCPCGFTKHRDVVGAMNIRYAPVIDGKSQSA